MGHYQFLSRRILLSGFDCAKPSRHMPPRRRTVFLCSRYVILYAERHFTIRIKPKSTSRAWPFDANLQQRPAKPLFAAKCETPLPRLVAPRGVGNANTSRPFAPCAPFVPIVFVVLVGDFDAPGFRNSYTYHAAIHTVAIISIILLRLNITTPAF